MLDGFPEPTKLPNHASGLAVGDGILNEVGAVEEGVAYEASSL